MYFYQFIKVHNDAYLSFSKDRLDYATVANDP